MKRFSFYGYSAVSAVFVFTAACFILYSDVLVNGVFIFDDFEYIIGNVLVQNLSNFRHMSDPRYLGYLSFALNYAADGENPYGFHLVNICIHAANALLAYFLAGFICTALDPDDGAGKTGHRALAFFTGLFFVVHPIETQAVSYVTQRFTSLSAFFYLLSTVLYLSARLRIEKSKGASVGFVAYAIAVLSAVAAMKTKEIAFTIPFILAAFEVMVFRSSVFSGRRFMFLIPFAALLVIIPLSLFGPEWGILPQGTGVDEVTRKDKLYDLYERSAFEYLINQFRVVAIYVRLLFLPVNQQVVYDLRAAHSFFDAEVLSSLVFLLGIASLGPLFWRKAASADAGDSAYYRIASLGILWFFVTLSIESSIIPIKDIIFEHRAYLPSVGFFFSCGALLSIFLKKMPSLRRSEIQRAAVFILITLVFSAATYKRNLIWTDEVLFWGDVVEKTGKAIGYNNRGNAYFKAGQLDLALADLDKTISFFPASFGNKMAWENADFTPANMAKTYLSRGNVYMAMGDEKRARADFDMSRAVMMVGY